jgi:hypothetical protein
LLSTIDLPQIATSPAATRYRGTFSLIIDHSVAGFRRLPTLYLGKAQIFAERDSATIIERASAVIDATVEGARRSTFLLTPCRIDGRQGLYGRDVFNRSLFRIKLARLGMEFASNPFVVLEPNGTFESAEWGPIEPTFVILDGGGDTPEDVFTTEGALLVFTLATFRLGPLGPDDLAALKRVGANLRALASDEPEALIRTLSSIG